MPIGEAIGWLVAVGVIVGYAILFFRNRRLPPLQPPPPKPPPPPRKRTWFDDVAARIEAFLSGVAGFFGCLVALVFGLLALYVLVWIIKRMWEAA